MHWRHLHLICQWWENDCYLLNRIKRTCSAAAQPVQYTYDTVLIRSEMSLCHDCQWDSASMLYRVVCRPQSTCQSLSSSNLSAALLVLLCSVLDHRCIMHWICIGEFGVVVVDWTRLVGGSWMECIFWKKKIYSGPESGPDGPDRWVINLINIITIITI